MQKIDFNGKCSPVAPWSPECLTSEHCEMSTYEQLTWEAQQQAEEIYEPWRQNCREVLATMLELRSELTRNGVEHSSDNLVELTRLVLAKEWAFPRRGAF